MAAASATTVAASASRALHPSRRLLSARCGTAGRDGASPATPHPRVRVMKLLSSSSSSSSSSSCMFTRSVPGTHSSSSRGGGHHRLFCPNRLRTRASAPSDDTAFTTGYAGTTWASMTEEERYEEAYDMVVRLASTINAYDYVAFTSKSTNMGTYVYNALSRIPEQYRGLLVNELSDKGLINCWFIAGLLYKIKLVEREATGPMDISNDLEDYQERLERAAARASRGEEEEEEARGRESEEDEGVAVVAVEKNKESKQSVSDGGGDGRGDDVSPSSPPSPFGSLTDGGGIEGGNKGGGDAEVEVEVAGAGLKLKKKLKGTSFGDDDDYVDEDEDAVAARKRAVDAAVAGVQVFEGRAANVPGGPFINRFQKVFYPSPNDPGTWHGRVVVKKPKFIEKYIPLYFKTNDTLERFLKVPSTAEDADLMLDYQNPPYLEADMPPAMEYPSRRTPGDGSQGTWWPIPKLPLPPFDTLVDYLRPLGPGVYAGRGWRGGGNGDEFLTFILFRRYDVLPDDMTDIS